MHDIGEMSEVFKH